MRAIPKDDSDKPLEVRLYGYVVASDPILEIIIENHICGFILSCSLDNVCLSHKEFS